MRPKYCFIQSVSMSQILLFKKCMSQLLRMKYLHLKKNLKFKFNEMTRFYLLTLAILALDPVQNTFLETSNLMLKSNWEHDLH